MGFRVKDIGPVPIFYSSEYDKKGDNDHYSISFSPFPQSPLRETMRRKKN